MTGWEEIRTAVNCDERRIVTFSSASEFDTDPLVYILGEVENGLALWFFAWRGLGRSSRASGSEV